LHAHGPNPIGIRFFKLIGCKLFIKRHPTIVFLPFRGIVEKWDLFASNGILFCRTCVSWKRAQHYPRRYFVAVVHWLSLQVPLFPVVPVALSELIALAIPIVCTVPYHQRYNSPPPNRSSSPTSSDTAATQRPCSIDVAPILRFFAVSVSAPDNRHTTRCSAAGTNCLERQWSWPRYLRGDGVSFIANRKRGTGSLHVAALTFRQRAHTVASGRGFDTVPSEPKMSLCIVADLSWIMGGIWDNTLGVKRVRRPKIVQRICFLLPFLFHNCFEIIMQGYRGERYNCLIFKCPSVAHNRLRMVVDVANDHFRKTTRHQLRLSKSAQ